MASDDRDHLDDLVSNTLTFDDLIARVYDVALDPLRLEELVDAWETSIAQFRGPRWDLSFLENGTVRDHVTRAQSILESISAAAEQDSNDELLARFAGVAAIVVDPELVLQAATPAAQQNLAAEVEASIQALQIEPADLDVLVRECRDLFAATLPHTPMLRVRAAQKQHIIIVHMRRIERSDKSKAIVIACSELHFPDELGAMLREFWGLTPAEAEIAIALTKGLSPQEVASFRNRSAETVRGQIKTILSKTEVRNQVELIRMIMSLLAIAAPDAPWSKAEDDPLANSGGVSKLERLTFQTVILPNQRRMDYLLIGDPIGRPVMFLPNAFGYQRLTASAEFDLRRRGVRLIVPILPGYGRSSGVPIKAHYGQEAARDLARLLDHLKVSQITGITISGAHNYLSELEKIRPDSTRLIIATAGLLPFDRAQQFQRMGKWHRFVQSTGRFNPRILPFVVRAGFRMAASKGPANFLKSVFKSSPADLRVIADPEALEAFLASSVGVNSPWHSAHVALAQQTMNVEREDQSALLKWMSARVPVHFLNGDQDVGMRMETLNELRSDFPDITFHIIENAGQLIVYSHWRYVFDLLDCLEKEAPQAEN